MLHMSAPTKPPNQHPVILALDNQLCCAKAGWAIIEPRLVSRSRKVMVRSRYGKLHKDSQPTNAVIKMYDQSYSITIAWSSTSSTAREDEQSNEGVTWKRTQALESLLRLVCLLTPTPARKRFLASQRPRAPADTVGLIWTCVYICPCSTPPLSYTRSQGGGRA